MSEPWRRWILSVSPWMLTGVTAMTLYVSAPWNYALGGLGLVHLLVVAYTLGYDDALLDPLMQQRENAEEQP